MLADAVCKSKLLNDFGFFVRYFFKAQYNKRFMLEPGAVPPPDFRGASAGSQWRDAAADHQPATALRKNGDCDQDVRRLVSGQ